MRFIFSIVSLFFVIGVCAQDPASLMEEARKLELKLKDEEAFKKYKEVVLIKPTHQLALIKCAELSCAIGGRTATPEEKTVFFQQAKKYADAAMKIDTNNAEAHYIMAIVFGKLTEVEKKNDEVVKQVKYIKQYIDRSIALNAEYGKAWHVLGKWHLEVVSLNVIKKAAVKLIYGGVGDATIQKAISYMEKCKTMEPYYCLNFLDLARAYEYNEQYEKSIGVLQQLAKLPTRRQEDIATKAQGAALLQKLQ